MKRAFVGALAALLCALSAQAQVNLAQSGGGLASGVTGVLGYANGGTGSSQLVVAQSAVPLIIPSSGSMANNCAITLTTALPTIYTAAYLYLPAGAIQTSSTAGLYYTVMSSTTVGTCYNNTYTTGQPAVVGSPTAFVSTGPGAYTQTQSALSLLSVSLPANTLGANGELDMEYVFSVPNNANTKQNSWKYGGTVMASSSVTTTLGTAVFYRMRNAGVTNVQTSVSGGSGTAAIAIIRGAIDSTQAQTILITGTLTTSALDFFVLEGYSIKVYPN